MTRFPYCVFLFILCIWDVEANRALRRMFPDKYPTMLQNGVDPGSPLFLTPYVQKGQFDMAQKLSRVGPLDGTSLQSYAGFFTVNATTNSNMFFWFFPAQQNPETAPVLLWLQGGPGGSSLFGLFVENGPLMVDKNIKLGNRKITWNTKYSMIYIDNPVGTGFSFTDKDEGYATNEEDVARDLYSCLTQFFQVFYQYQKNDFYATGESYAGKYVPAISYKIHIENPTAKTKINLKGMAIGDGLCDPATMMGQYAPFLYSIGLLDEKQRGYFQAMTDKAVVYIQNKNFKAAFNVFGKLILEGEGSFFQNCTGNIDIYNYLLAEIFDTLLNGDLTPNAPYFYNITNIRDYYNFLLTEQPEDFNYYGNYLAKPEVRAAIHVGNLTYNDGSKVEIHLVNDVMDTVKPWIATLMDHYKVMMYSGQLDIIIAVPLTEAFLLTVDWSGQDQYRQVDRLIWRVNPNDKEVAGYVRQVKQFYQVIVRDAGHILPYDQPERGYDMIQRFIEERGWTS